MKNHPSTKLYTICAGAFNQKDNSRWEHLIFDNLLILGSIYSGIFLFNVMVKITEIIDDAVTKIIIVKLTKNCLFK